MSLMLPGDADTAVLSTVFLEARHEPAAGQDVLPDTGVLQCRFLLPPSLLSSSGWKLEPAFSRRRHDDSFAYPSHIQSGTSALRDDSGSPKMSL